MKTKNNSNSKVNYIFAQIITNILLSIFKITLVHERIYITNEVANCIIYYLLYYIYL